MPKKPACDSCHRKKISCDRHKPRCEWCKHRNITCTYERPEAVAASAKLSTRPRTQRQQIAPPSLEAASPEVVVTNGTSTSSQEIYTTPATPRLDGVMFHGGFHFAGFDLGDVSYNNGIPVFSERARLWIQACTGVMDGFSSMYEQPHASLTSLDVDMMRMLRILDVSIPRHVLQTWVNVWNSSFLRLVFPVVHPDSFRDTIEAAYNNTGLVSSTVIGSKSCLLAFVTMMSKLIPEHMSSQFRDSAVLFASAAEHYLLSSLAQPTLEGLQTCLMLAIFRDMSGQLQAAGMLVSLACRCVCALGGHQQLDSPLAISPNEDNYARQLFWLCYFLDKHVSLRTGQPPTLHDEELDLELPISYDYYALPYNTSQNGTIDDSRVLYPSDLSLTILKSRILDVLNPQAVAKKTNIQLLADIAAMDAELESWRLSVPEHLRPRLSVVADTIHGNMHQGAKMLVIYFHLEYFYLLATVHGASGRTQMWWDIGPLESGALKSSMQVSVEASRSSLRLLKAGVWDVHTHSLCMFVFYPIWASMTIFCHILYDPRSPNAAGDLSLLKLMPQVMKSIPSGQLTAADETRLTAFGDFLDEITRLGSIAVANANAKPA